MRESRYIQLRREDDICLGLGVGVTTAKHLFMIIAFLHWHLFIGIRESPAERDEKKQAEKKRQAKHVYSLADGCIPEPDNLVNVKQVLR